LDVPWAQVASSPRPTQSDDTGLESLAKLCGERDGGLDEIAQSLAEGRLTDGSVADIDALTTSLHLRGVPYVWPRAWSLGGAPIPQQEAEKRLKEWLHAYQDVGKRRCGFARATRDGAPWLAAVAVDALADLGRTPMRVRTGGWVEIEATALVPTASAKIVVLGPTGAPRAIPTSLAGGKIRGRFAADRPGAWLVQVLGTVETGPRPVLEALVWAGDAQPVNPRATAPGEDAPSPSDDATTALLAMINGARAAERLPPLRRDPRLDEVALRHSQAMVAAHRVGHDVGDGDPAVRIAEALPNPRAAGENVAKASSVRRAHRSLWASPSHRGNLLMTDFSLVGLGIVQDDEGALWVTEAFAGP